MIDIVILAAGKGTRMRSKLPKVLHPIGGKPMLSHVMEAGNAIGETTTHVVIGHGSEQVKNFYPDIEAVNWVEQQEQLGTGHAVLQVIDSLKDDSITLILYGDVPLIQKQTLTRLIQQVSDNQMALLTVTLDDPSGYGRIVRDIGGSVTAIVEQKDASKEVLAINEVNTGIMAVKTEMLKQWLPLIGNDNAQKEYYLTDLISMAVAEGIKVKTEQPNEIWEVLGVNNRLQQSELERIYQKNIAEEMMKGGVTLLDQNRFDCRGEVDYGMDVVIDVNVVFEGKVTIGDNVVIGPNCVIKHSTIGDNTIIKANSIIEDSTIGSECDIGPYARIRPGCKLANKAKIGNFVETKKAMIGEGSKVNHLSYVGDATLGKDVNIGAGTITCNYDGVNKHQTIIGDDVFVGSNSALVAPVTIGDGATIGAGSTINKPVEKNKLSLTRAPQRTINDWVRPTKKH